MRWDQWKRWRELLCFSESWPQISSDSGCGSGFAWEKRSSWSVSCEWLCLSLILCQTRADHLTAKVRSLSPLWLRSQCQSKSDYLFIRLVSDCPHYLSQLFSCSDLIVCSVELLDFPKYLDWILWHDVALIMPTPKNNNINMEGFCSTDVILQHDV